MPDQQQLNILRNGASIWNQWRLENPSTPIDLSQAELNRADLGGAHLQGADLTGALLYEADLHGAMLTDADLSLSILAGADLSSVNFTGANLSQTRSERAKLFGSLLFKAQLRHANLREADLTGATLACADLTGAILFMTNLEGVFADDVILDGAVLVGADLRDSTLKRASFREANLNFAYLERAELDEAILTRANLQNAHLNGARLQRANLAEADLAEADLSRAVLVETVLDGANITGAKIYGISAWDLKTEGIIQENLVITSEDQSTITVDDLEVAQFIYLLLNNEKIHNVINSITSKAVLLLGRFTAERKAVLNALREKLRHDDYLPIVFDFDKPSGKNLTETVSILAHMARFVIADLTDPKSIPQELQRIVPDNPSLPVQPLILASQYEYAMFKDLLDYPWVLVPYRYESLEDLLASLQEAVITPVEAKAKEIDVRRKAIEKEMTKGRAQRKKTRGA